MLSHYSTGLNEELVRHIVCTIIIERKKEIEEVAGSWLRTKEINLEGYMRNISQKRVKFDELGITLFCMSARCHVGIINCDDTIWTTCATNDIEDCDIIFLNRGDMNLDMVEENDEEIVEKNGNEGRKKERGEMLWLKGVGEIGHLEMSPVNSSIKGKNDEEEGSELEMSLVKSSINGRKDQEECSESEEKVESEDSSDEEEEVDSDSAEGEKCEENDECVSEDEVASEDS